MNDHSTLTALGNAVATVVVFGGLTLVLATLGALVSQTYVRASRHEATAPLPLGAAFAQAAREVLIARPMRLHHSRMEVVRRMEAQRAEALAEQRAAAALRHPSNYAARKAAMAAHPSAALVAVQALEDEPATAARPRLTVVDTWGGGDAA